MWSLSSMARRSVAKTAVVKGAFGVKDGCSFI